MPFLLFFGFIAWLVIEVVSIGAVTSWLGLLPMLLLLLLAMIIGFAVIRSQALMMGQRMLRAMRAGTSPEKPLLDAAILNFAGFLLITPGFASDVIALLLLFPPTRSLVWSSVSARVKTRFYRPGSKSADATAAPLHKRPESDDVIDVEFTEVKADKNNQADKEATKASPWRRDPRGAESEASEP